MNRSAPAGRSYIAVIGGGSVAEAAAASAYETGRLIAAEGWVLLNGGLAGVMEAASRGAAEAGGLVIGILPGTEREEGNQYLSLALPTGLGHLRNAVLVTMSDAVIAVDGGYGTLSEIAFAHLRGKPVIGISTGGWGECGSLFTAVARTPLDAVAAVRRLIGKRADGTKGD